MNFILVSKYIFLIFLLDVHCGCLLLVLENMIQCLLVNDIKDNMNLFSFCLQHTSLSPDGKLLAVVGDNPKGLLVDSQTGKVGCYCLSIL